MTFRSAALLLVLAGCASDDAPRAAARFETVAGGLYTPWAIAFAPDGRLFVTERPGRIRTITNGRLDDAPWAAIDSVIQSGESGLLGIALHPDFATSPNVYVVATFLSGGRLVNRVLRFTEAAGRGGAPHRLIDDLPAAEFHAGGAIAFGPDGMLYVTTGDAGDPDSAADPQSLAGKILRYTPGGALPADNPTAGSPVYALGLRNVQGLAWSAGELFATDHGPSGFPSERFRRNQDELNAILAGKNYGWPDVAGSSEDARFVSPLLEWTPAIAPAGLAIAGDTAYVGGLRGHQLRRAALVRSGSGRRAEREEVLFEDELGRIRAVTVGPDGAVYFTTSNWDGRGEPAPNDDRVLRLVTD